MARGDRRAAARARAGVPGSADSATGGRDRALARRRLRRLPLRPARQRHRLGRVVRGDSALPLPHTGSHPGRRGGEARARTRATGKRMASPGARSGSARRSTCKATPTRRGHHSSRRNGSRSRPTMPLRPRPFSRTSRSSSSTPATSPPRSGMPLRLASCSTHMASRSRTWRRTRISRLPASTPPMRT